MSDIGMILSFLAAGGLVALGVFGIALAVNLAIYSEMRRAVVVASFVMVIALACFLGGLVWLMFWDSGR